MEEVQFPWELLLSLSTHSLICPSVLFSAGDLQPEDWH